MEKRRYKITSFREVPNTTDVRVLLVSAELVKQKKEHKTMDMLKNPVGFAQDLMQNQMNQMIHDTFLISQEEYLKNKYMVGEIVIVTIEREK